MPRLMLRGSNMYEAVCNELKIYKEENARLQKRVDYLFEENKRLKEANREANHFVDSVLSEGKR